MNLAEVIQQPGQKERVFRDEIFKSLHVAMPGEVMSYNPDKRTVTVQTSIRPIKGSEKPPILVDVPVFFYGNITFVPQKGDGCLVIFADSCIDAWIQNGGITNPISYRSHDMSDGFAFIGFRQSGGVDIWEKLISIEHRLEALEAPLTVARVEGAIPLTVSSLEGGASNEDQTG